MAPLSILPGRVRFEDERLLGNKERSRHLEAKIAVIPGVHLVSATHRTGRVLVEFNEVQLTHDDLVARISETLACDVPMAQPHYSGSAASAPPVKGPLFHSGDILADMAFHLLVPAPFDLLLPALGSTLRRGQTLPC